MKPDKIKELRVKCGWNQYQLAKLVGVSQAYISNIEKGYVTLTKDLVTKIKQVFDFEIKALKERKKTKKK